MKLSVIVVFYNMRREAERTLYTLSAEYQKNIDVSEWEVIAVDNGSSDPLDEAMIDSLVGNFSYLYYDTQSPSPCAAINEAVRRAKGDWIAISIDGARMLTPGMIYYMTRAMKIFDRPFVCALGWHLGEVVQNLALETGYDQREEDRLLESVDWRGNGYELFSISTLAPSSGRGYFDEISESSFFSLSLDDYLALGGFDERFQAPGGGRANIDFYKRASERPGVKVVHLLGEGAFHQFHGGVTTNVTKMHHPRKENLREYREIRGMDYRKPRPKLHHFGHMPDQARRFIYVPANGSD